LLDVTAAAAPAAGAAAQGAEAPRVRAMSAADIAVALGNARREGRGWRCRCPLHNGRSLTLHNGEGPQRISSKREPGASEVT